MCVLHEHGVQRVCPQNPVESKHLASSIEHLLQLMTAVLKRLSTITRRNVYFRMHTTFCAAKCDKDA